MMKTELIVALNYEDPAKAKEFIDKTKEIVDYYKIDAGLYVKDGISLVKYIKDKGKRVFIDLKFHDIPSTVARAVRSCIELGVDMCNLHALGGFEQMEAAVKTKWAAGTSYPLLLGVTILTSLNEASIRDLFGTKRSLIDEVMMLAELSRSAGLDGVVASPQETREIRKAMGSDFIIVTPGVRPSWAPPDEHARVYTPKQAKEEGSNFIVVGRPIIQAKDPIEAIEKIKEELSE